MTNSKSPRRDVFATITDAIASQLERGVRPWAKPWRDGVAPLALHMPHNIAGRPYRGGNVPFLWATAEARGYSSPVWLTFNQARDKGGAVRKGEKGSPVFFWKFEEVQGEHGLERRVWAKSYTVFNAEQCDGVALPQLREKPLSEPERIAAAEALMESTGAHISYGGDRAYYHHALDGIRLPDRGAFLSADCFYGTAFHELGHWTGHTSRLNRTFGARFGDPVYAFEELIAELTAAFVCASQGFASIEREDHAAYLASWLRGLQDDPRAFVRAAGMAQKAADFILATAEAKGEEEPAEGDAIAA